MVLKETSPDRISEHLCRSMEQKVEALEKYLLITQNLRKRLDSEDVEGIRTLLGQRQDLIRTMDQITASIKEVAIQPCPGQSLATVQLHNRWNLLCKTARDLLEETASVDAECLTRVCLLRDKVRNELRDLGASEKVRRAYAQRFSPSPRFMDVEH